LGGEKRALVFAGGFFPGGGVLVRTLGSGEEGGRHICFSKGMKIYRREERHRGGGCEWGPERGQRGRPDRPGR